MATDLYAKCPCGSGKKIKFCCRDIISDIERIERMLRGEQRTAALEKIDRLLSKHPDRPALLALKAQALFELNQVDDAKPVVDRLLEVEPDNVTALAMQATLAAADNDMQHALKFFHRAMRMSDGVLSPTVYKSYLSICVRLVQLGKFIAAYAHLMTLVSITRGADRASISMLMNVTSSETLPTIFQGLTVSDSCLDRVTWKREFESAMDLFRHGDWSETVALLEDMCARILDEPILLWNLAILQAWTLQDEKAVKTFRMYASIHGLELDNAVEAEACAQVLEPVAKEDMHEAIRLSHDIDDAESLMERFLSDDTVESVPGGRNPSDPDAPPPQGQFILYDRAQPADPDRAALTDLPREYATVTVHGRETDRSARLVVMLLKDDDYAANLGRISVISGQTISTAAETEVLGRVHRVQRLFRANFRVPTQVTLDRYNELLRAWIADQFETVWPTIQLSLFTGRTARQAAQQPQYKKAVLAAILNLELWSDRHRSDFDFNRLRQSLSLPIRETLDPTDVDIRELSPARLVLVDLDKLSDDDLTFLFEVTSVRRNGSFLSKIGSAVLQRPAMKDHLDLIEVHERLAELAFTSDDQLEHLRRARDIAVGRGESPAHWLVSELDVRLSRMETDQARRLISEIQSRYLREPGIAQSFAAVADKYGLVPPDAASATEAESSAEAATEPEAAAAPSRRVWTPDHNEPAPTEGDQGKESKLWIPGMD